MHHATSCSPQGSAQAAFQWPRPICNTLTAETYSGIGPISHRDTVLVDIGVLLCRCCHEECGRARGATNTFQAIAVRLDGSEVGNIGGDR